MRRASAFELYPLLGTAGDAREAVPPRNQEGDDTAAYHPSGAWDEYIHAGNVRFSTWGRQALHLVAWDYAARTC